MNQLLSWGLAIVRDAQSLASPALTGGRWGRQPPRDRVLLPRPPAADLLVRRQAPRDSGSASSYSSRSVVNLRLKLAFAQPRPYDLDPSVAMAKKPPLAFPRTTL